MTSWNENHQMWSPNGKRHEIMAGKAGDSGIRCDTEKYCLPKMTRELNRERRRDNEREREKRRGR